MKSITMSAIALFTLLLSTMTKSHQIDDFHTNIKTSRLRLFKNKTLSTNTDLIITDSGDEDIPLKLTVNQAKLWCMKTLPSKECIVYMLWSHASPATIIQGKSTLAMEVSTSPYHFQMDQQNNDIYVVSNSSPWMGQTSCQRPLNASLADLDNHSVIYQVDAVKMRIKRALRVEFFAGGGHDVFQSYLKDMVIVTARDNSYSHSWRLCFLDMSGVNEASWYDNRDHNFISISSLVVFDEVIYFSVFKGTRDEGDRAIIDISANIVISSITQKEDEFTQRQTNNLNMNVTNYAKYTNYHKKKTVYLWIPHRTFKTI